MKICIKSLSTGNKETEADVMNLISRCYLDPNEIKTIQTITTQASMNDSNSDYDLECLIGYLNEEPIGLIIGSYFKESNCGMVEYLCVVPEHRRKGYGKELYEYYKSLLEPIAYLKTEGRYTKPFMIFGKVRANESRCRWYPKFDNSNIAFAKSLKFGFFRISFSQPALEIGLMNVSYYLIAGEKLIHNVMFNSGMLLCMFYDLFRYSYGKDNPDACKEYILLRTQIESSSRKD